LQVEVKTIELSSFDSFLNNKSVYRNTLILCVTWSVSSYSFYFVEFYLRLVPTNTIYIQKMLMGCADIFATVIYYLLITRIGMILSFKILFVLLAFGSLSIVSLLAVNNIEDGSEPSPQLSACLSILIMVMRVSSFATFAINYSQVIELTPTLMNGLVFGIVNTAARGVSIFAPLVAELVQNSSWSVSLFAVVGIWAVTGFQKGTKIE